MCDYGILVTAEEAKDEIVQFSWVAEVSTDDLKECSKISKIITSVKMLLNGLSELLSEPITKELRRHGSSLWYTA